MSNAPRRPAPPRPVRRMGPPITTKKKRRSADDIGLGCFIAWFIFCTLVALVWGGLLVWLVIAAIGYLSRH